MFITFEGPDGSGKTTQIGLLADLLAGRGYNVLKLREPGGTAIGNQIRQVLHDLDNEEMDAHTEFLLYSASRAQLVAERIRPHLATGGIVLCDRFADSSLAYQGYGRGLDLNAIRQITLFATGGLKPDLTLYLDIDPMHGLTRRSANGEEWNRMDAPPLEFHQRVREGYYSLMAAEPARWIKIDADQSVEDVHTAIALAIERRLHLV